MTLFHLEPCEVSPNQEHLVMTIQGGKGIRWVCEHCCKDTTISPKEALAMHKHTEQVIAASRKAFPVG